MEKSLKSGFMGSMLGSALGDAVGELAFRFPDKGALLDEVDRSRTLIYTDDTAMALGLARSLVEVGDLDQEQLGERFRLDFEQEPWRGYAQGPPTIFSRVKSTGCTYVDAARRIFRGEGSLGNGAAMRVAPLGLFFHGEPDLHKKARASAEITHAHPVGMDGAAVQATAVGLALHLNPGEPLDIEKLVSALQEVSSTTPIREKLHLLKELLITNAPPQEAAPLLGRTVAVHESLPFALYAFLRHSDAFEECLLCAVLHGGDRDTLGAMACAVSGAYLGVEALPRAWLDRLENRQYMEGLALDLHGRSEARKGKRVFRTN